MHSQRRGCIHILRSRDENDYRLVVDSQALLLLDDIPFHRPRLVQLWSPIFILIQEILADVLVGL